MAATETLQAKCFGCGFEAPAGGEAWETADHPPLGTVVQCPECGSTDIHSRRQPRELADGVHAIDLTISHEGRDVPFHPGAVETDRGLLLLDVGLPDALKGLEHGLDSIGRGWADVWGVLLTHQDASSPLDGGTRRRGPQAFQPWAVGDAICPSSR